MAAITPLRDVGSQQIAAEQSLSDNAAEQQHPTVHLSPLYHNPPPNPQKVRQHFLWLVVGCKSFKDRAHLWNV